MTAPPPRPLAEPEHVLSVKELLTSGVVTACYYAHRPEDRPRCEGLAVVRYGPTALCVDCDRRRSAVGKGTAPVRLPDPGTLLDVIAVRDACRQAEVALREAVGCAPARRAALVGRRGRPRHISPAAQQRFDGCETH